MRESPLKTHKEKSGLGINLVFVRVFKTPCKTVFTFKI